MKKMKVLIALVLAIFVLVACTHNPVGTTTVPGTTGQDSTTAPTKRPIFTIPTEPVPDPVITELYLPAEVDNPDNLPVLQWVCLSDGFVLDPDRLWREDAMVELNQMLADKNMPFRVQIQILFSDQRMDYPKWFSVPEAQEAMENADLIWGHMQSAEMQQYLMPITQYIGGTAEPSLENLVAHALNWSVGTVDGQIYGAPLEVLQSITVGWRVDPAFLAKYDLKPEDFQKAGLEPDALFAQIYSKNGKMPFLRVDTNGFAVDGMTDACRPIALMPFLDTYHLVGSCFAVDYSGGAPRVINYLESGAVRSYHAALMRYQEAGYTKDTPSPVQLYSYNADHICEVYGNIYIPVTEPVYTYTAPGHYITGIAAGTEHKEDVLSLLSLIADDEAFQMQLFYGKEGRDYAIEDGEYILLEDENGASYSLSCLLSISRFCGLYNSYGYVEAWGTIPMPTKNGMDELETYRALIDSSFVCCPITFDYTGLEEELSALEKEMELYFTRFLKAEESGNKLPMDEGGYDQMLQAFKAAGGDRIQAELQRQLDAWLAENPDWNK